MSIDPMATTGGSASSHAGRLHREVPEHRASAGPQPPTTRRLGRKRVSLATYAVIAELVLIVLVWQWLQGDLKIVNPVFLPPPSRILESFLRLASSGDLASHAMASLSNFLIGYSLAAVTGVVLGLFIGGWRPALKLVAPLIWALYAMPLIAIRPMTTIWFGFGNNPIIFLVFLSALLPVILNTIAGVHTVDPSIGRAASVFGASRLQTYRKVILPATVPFVLVGLRLAVVTGWIILLASEFYGAPRGFGQILAVASSRFRVADAFAVIAVIVVLSVLSVKIIGLLESRVSSWRSTSRSR